MRCGLVFIAAAVGAGCPAGPPPARPPVIASPPAAAPVLSGVRGDRCDAGARCGDGLTCLAWPGGYCASECEGACCTQLDRGDAGGGDRCLAGCTRDADCRADEGYACDPAWHACVIPNTTALVPNRCPLSLLPDDPAGFGAPIDEDIDLEAAGARATIGKRLFEAYPAEGGLRIRASDDGGSRWDAQPEQTPLVGNRGDLVASGRTLYAAALVGSRLGGYGSADQRVDLAISRDAGATWSAPITVSGRDESVPFYLSGPAIAVDARRDLVYVAYIRGHRRGIWDVAIATGKPGPKGRVWTRTAIGDGCVLRALPSIAVDEASGVLHVAYLDSANGLVHATCANGACTPRGTIARFAFSTAVRTGPASLGERTILTRSPAGKLTVHWRPGTGAAYRATSR